MKSYLHNFADFTKVERAVLVAALILVGNGAHAKMQEAILYEGYHHKGVSQLLTFESCQNIPVGFNDKASSLDARGECVRLYENRCCQGRSIELPVGSPFTEDLYNAEFDDVVSSISPCGNYVDPQPPNILQEKWLNHSEVLDKVFSDDDIVIYHDKNVNRRTKWLDSERFVGDAWRYLKRNYNLDQIAGLTRNEKLHVIFHSGKSYASYYNFSSALTYFDVSSECRNIIDISSSESTSGPDTFGDQLDLISQQFGNMVIYLYRGGKDAPTFLHLDKNDEEFVKIITFDMYRGLNMSKEQDRFFTKALTSKGMGSSETEKKFVNWFKDWYYPIYKRYGELHVVRKYLKLSAAYYPTVSATRHFNISDSEHGAVPLRMNVGEFVHFWSGVTHQNLQSLAIRAFGWTMLNEYQLIQAQKDFPKLTY